MTTQAAAAAAANGMGAHAGSVAVKKELSPPVPDGKNSTAAAATAGSRGGTPAADGSRSGSPAAGAAAAGGASVQGTPEAAAAGTPVSKEDAELRQAEDELLAQGQAIAGVRALLAKAFSRPAEEPALPMGHWDFLLREMRWLANDVAQERLWKQTAAMAVAHEVAKLRGKFGLRPPPDSQRTYHDEIASLRAAVAKETAEKAGGRRSAAKAAAESNGAAALKLDPADDPIFRDLSFELSLELPGGSSSSSPGGRQQQPSTPPLNDPCSLTFQHDDEFQEALEQHLMQSDIERLMREEMAAREYRFEYEAALASHHMAVQEQNRRAMRLDADMADNDGLVPMDEDLAEEDDYAGKKAKNRKRQRSGYLLEDFASLGGAAAAGAAAAGADETESMGTAAPKQKAASRQYIEDTYLQRKRRRERYKDVDVDYDVGMETAGRYGTRANRALATRAGATRAQDPNKRKQQLGRADSFQAGVAGGAGGQGAMGARGGAGQRLGAHGMGAAGAGGMPGPVIWNKAEDDLLLAITHEFGVNWTMVSEVLSLSLSMQGIFRPPHLCKQRFRQITQPMLQAQAQAQAGPGQEVAVDYSEEKALMALYMAMTKQQARELIVLSLPVHDDVMMRMLEALVQVGATAKTRRQTEEKRNEQGRKMQEPHPSHNVVHAAIMQKTGNKHLTPMELAVQVDVAYAQQAKQHQMLQQQAQQAAQLQAQQAAAPPPPGQQQAAAAAAAAAAAGAGGAPGVPPGAAGGPGMPPGGMQAAAGAPGGPPAQGMPAPGQGVAAGTPAAVAGLAAQQQQQQHGMPGSATPPLPAGMPPQAMAQAAAAGAAAQQQQPGMQPQGQPGGPMPSPAGVPGHPPQPRPAAPQITLQQLNHILETGKLPNGQPLEPPMRKAIEDKKNAYLAQMAAMQQQQMQMRMAQQQAAAAAAGGGGPGAPGQPSAATQAALQAAQQAAAVQAGMRPPMPMPGVFRPGMPGTTLPVAGQPGAMPPGAAGMPGQPGMPVGAMQPALLQQQMAQMAAAGGNPAAVGMQALQPGMQLPAAAQQQLIAQQFAMQQQAAAAAAAQQQAAAAAAAAAQPGAGQQHQGS